MAAASPARARRTRLDFEFTPTGLTLNDIVGFCLPYLSIRDACSLKCASKQLACAAASHSPEHLAIVKSTLHSSGPSVRVFETYGSCLLSLAVSFWRTGSCAERGCCAMQSPHRSPSRHRCR